MPCLLLLVTATVVANPLPMAGEPIETKATGFDRSVPTPQQVLGFTLGERHARSHQVARYFETVAEASDRVEFIEYGRSHDNRRLIAAVVTSPENLRNQAQIRADLQAQVRGETDEYGGPLVLWMGYGVHGNEASATEASLMLLYYMAAGQGPEVDRVLNETVTLIVPNYNPDGRDRFVNWVNGNRGKNALSDPNDREHRSPWPSGRTNHYLFDLNRDWLPLTQPESQTRMMLWNEWHPHVTTDYHEMGGNSTYFFQPGVPERTNPLTLDRNQELTAEIALFYEDILDKEGELYYTRERFDDFYPGKGSTYPDLRGSVGILFEQGSSRALLAETRFGELPYAETVRNQVLTSLATLDAVVELQDELKQMKQVYYHDARERLVNSFGYDGYRIRTRNHAHFNEVATLLGRHRIGHYRDHLDVVVPINQPEARLAVSLFETRTEFEDDEFYDVSTWNLALAVDGRFTVEEEIQETGDLSFISERPFYSDSTLSAAEPYPLGTISLFYGEQTDVGYILTGGADYIARMLELGVQVLYLPGRPEVKLPVGDSADSSLRTTGANFFAPKEFRGISQDVEAAHSKLFGKVVGALHPVASSSTPEGIDLGSNDVDVLEKPEIALVSGASQSSYRVGEVWHMLDVQYDLPVSLVDAERINRETLRRYNRLIVTGSSSALDYEAVRDWVRDGGVLIAINTGMIWADNADLFDLESNRFSPDTSDLPYGEAGEERGRHNLGGAIFEGVVQQEHPLALGLDETIPLFRAGETFFLPSATRSENVILFSDDPLLSGYASDEVLDTARGAAAMLARRYGRGSVVLLADTPNFRAFFTGTNRLLLNSILLGKSF